MKLKEIKQRLDTLDLWEFERKEIDDIIKQALALQKEEIIKGINDLKILDEKDESDPAYCAGFYCALSSAIHLIKSL